MHDESPHFIYGPSKGDAQVPEPFIDLESDAMPERLSGTADLDRAESADPVVTWGAFGEQREGAD